MAEGVTGLAEAFGAPVPIKFGGDGWQKEYTMSPPTLAAMAEAEQWLESKAVEDVLSRMKEHGDTLSPAAREAIVANAISHAAEVSMANMQTTQYMAFISLRVRHPKITLEEVAELITVSDLPCVQAILDKFSGREDGESGEADAPQIGEPSSES